jgi:exodeoxyribonuclease I
MAASFFFYDLETSGISPRRDRVMQFAGQRTDLDLKPLGEPVNVLIKLTPDVLPQPDAVLIHGITPQKTLTEGVTEAEFLKLFNEEIVKPDMIFVGFNNLRFDDEFIRFMNYRNFYDAYEWHWMQSRTRWDLLDAARMTRALRPDGIKWPFSPEGKPTNRLEYLTSLNKLSHTQAHDALNDVMATIEVARLLKSRQPKIFEHLLSIRKKDAIKRIVEGGKPFMYTSGRYPSEFLHTTAAVMLGRPAPQDYILVYDLRVDPEPFLKMGVEAIIAAWRYNPDPKAVRLPVKTLKYNRCPAIAPGVVQDKATLERLQLSVEEVADNLAKVTRHGKAFAEKIFTAVQRMDEERERTQMTLVADDKTADERLYDGFIDKADADLMRSVRAAKPEELSGFADRFEDGRLKSLLPLYKARNYPKSLTAAEQAQWDKFVQARLMGGGSESVAAQYFARLSELAKGKLSGEQKYLLEELQLYGQSLIPGDEDG